MEGSDTCGRDTPANREELGSTGTADDSARYPQVRDLLATDASTRGTLAVVSGPSGGPKAEGEQALLDTMLTRYPGVFTDGRLWVLDRNFRAPRGALAYRPRSGHGLEEGSVGLMAYLDP